MVLPPKAMINKSHFYNACYNNWHGYGIIIKKPKKFEVVKQFKAEGNDPDEIWDIVNDNKDHERIVHVRYSTRGATDETNTQPFEVFNNGTRRVMFMHNGTLNGFGEWNQSVSGGKSDTNAFCETVLSKSLRKWSSDENGLGDYTDPDFIKLVVDKQWTMNSRGIFVSNDLPNMMIGNRGYTGWQLYKHPDASTHGEIWVSNDEYFDKLTRGPKFDEQEKIKKAAEEARRQAERDNAPFQGGSSRTSSETSSEIAGITIFKKETATNEAVLTAINDIIDTWDLNDPKDVSKLRFIAYEEWVGFLEEQKNNSDFVSAAIIQQFADHICKLTMKVRSLELRHNKASQRVEELRKQLDAIEGDKNGSAAEAA